MSKLSQRIEEFGIPPIPSHPIGDICMVYRIPGAEKVGVLYVPEEHREVAERGVLLAAGLGALDKLADHGVEIGDIVEFGRYAGRERQDERARKEGEAGKAILRMKADDIQCSEDLIERLASGELTVKRSDGTDPNGFEFGTHFYERKAGK